MIIIIKDCKVCGKHYTLLEKYYNWYTYKFGDFSCKSCGSEYKLKKYNEFYVVLFYILGGYILITIFMTMLTKLVKFLTKLILSY